MDWKSRLLGITLAGGSILACSDKGNVAINYAPDATTGADSGPPSCNANPDPCCSDPDGGACLAKHADAGADAPRDAPNDANDAAD